MIKNIYLDRSEGKSVDQRASINPQDIHVHVHCTPAISVLIIMKLTLTQ